MDKKIRVRKTPNSRWHLYKATVTGYGCYGWGNTPAEARAKMIEGMEKEDAEMARRRKFIEGLRSNA